MTAVILHLSDIHIKTNKDPITNKGIQIAKSTFSFLPSASHVFIVVSGDIAFSGLASEYESAKALLMKIQETIKLERDCPISFVLAPGNHDCDFSKNVSARTMVIENLIQSDNPEIDDSVIKLCSSIQKDFFEFRQSIENTESSYDDSLWRTTCYEVEGKTLEFNCLNVSWVSKLKEEPGKLYFPIERYSKKPLDQVDIRIVVIHHPINWFSQSVYRPFRTFVRKIANIVISGHEHQGNVGLNNDAETNISAFVEGCVLQGDKPNLKDSSFNLIVIDLEVQQFSSTRYKWDGNLYKSEEEGSWSDYHNLPAKRTNRFAIKEEFQEILEDPGAFLKHPNSIKLSLSDIYVYPDLHRIGNGQDKRRVYISSSKLLSPDITADGILIEGEEKSGRTSLLYQLFRQYYDRGLLPLLINGKDLKAKSDADIIKLIKGTVERQYGESQVEDFFQTSQTEKILLLDDFDDTPIKAVNVRLDVLGMLRNRFGHLVVTVGEMFEISEILNRTEPQSVLTLAHYKLQPFGHALREKLIRRWHSIGSDVSMDDQTSIAQLDEAERLMNMVMQKMVIPALPLYLLTLLQSMDTGRSGDFKESALGHYYHYLLTEAFKNSGVRADKLTELFQYSAYLAWEYHRKNSKELSEIDLRAFNSQFSKEWHTVDFSKRLEILLKAKVLAKVGQDYSFRYPYIFYYLKGQYLSENLQDISIRDYISRCCKHLYVRDHANTVLFLAHHTNDDFVVRCIAEALHYIFKSHNPLKFNGDTQVVSKFIEDVPKLVYSGETPEVHRPRRNALRDQLDDGHDGLAESEEDSEELSLIAQLTMLFKTTEILGQVLKNQYSKINRVRKRELITDLFNGPLRAISNFYDFFEKYPEGLINVIEAALKRKGKIVLEDERKSVAKRIAANLIQFVTLGFLMRASQSANSENLLEDVHNVVSESETPAFKMIEIGILLDSPKDIPRGKLKEILKEVAKDLVARRVIQLMVLNHIYMFKTSERDMQWLSEELDFDLGAQHAIRFQENQRRIL